MTQKSPWNGCKIRIFCLIGPDQSAHQARTAMLELLEKFRISVVDVIAVDIESEPLKERSATTPALDDRA